MDESVDQKITSITAGITKTEIVEEKCTKKLIYQWGEPINTRGFFTLGDSLIQYVF